MTEYERLNRLFEQIADLPADEQAPAAERLTIGEPDLLARLLRLLNDAAAAAEDGFLAHPVLGGRVAIGAVQRTEPAWPGVPGFRLIEAIGRGSSGTVYRAESVGVLVREVAIKVLRSDLPPSARDRFRIEQRVLASLNHPNIAQVFSAGETEDGQPYVCVEHVPGEWITRAAASAGLGWRERVRLMIDAASAVQHIHTAGLLHRDLKPANMLVAVTPFGPRLTVIDFGAATKAEAVATESIGPRLVGTVAYMSPEQLVRGQRGDARSDIFSLGVILHELLSGAHPFGGDTAPLGEVVERLSAGSPPALPASAGRSVRELDAVIARACAPDPGVRYASAEHLSEDLSRVLAGKPVEASRASTLRRVRLFAGRRPLTVAASLGATLALVSLGIGLAAVSADNARRAAASERSVTGLIESVLAELNELSGSDAARRELAELVLHQIETDASLGGSDRARLWKALATEALADTAYNRRELAEAVRLRREVLALDTARLGSRPQDRGRRLRVLLSTIRLGDALAGVNPAESFAAYTEAHRAILAELDRDPADSRYRDELTWSYERLLPSVLKRDPAEADMMAGERLEVAAGLVKEQPDHPMRRFALACAEFWKGRTLGSVGRTEEALVLARRACERLDRLCAEQPLRFGFLSRQIIAYSQLTQMQTSTGSPEAVGSAERTLRLARALHERDADHAFAIRYLGSSLGLATEAHRLSGDRERAEVLDAELAVVLERIREIKRRQ